MKKRITACVLCAAALCGCTAGEKQVDNTQETKTYTYWCGFNSAASQKYNTMAEMPMYQEAEKKTGVHIEFVHPPVGQEAEQFNLMVASKDMTDIIEYGWKISEVGGLIGNAIISLNDLIDSSAPNLKKYLEDTNYDYDKQAKTRTGDYYGFPMLNSGKYRTFSGPILRKDWLDELGLDVPQTIDEWETVLTAFRDKKGAAAAFTGDSSLFWTTPSFANNFNSAYGIYRGLYVDNGKIKYGPTEPGFKDYLMKMHKWFDEGLLDNNFSTNSANTIDAQMTDGTSGARIGYVGSTIGVYLNLMKDKDPNYNLIAATYPVPNKGDTAIVANLSYDAEQPFAAISTECKDPEGAAKWLDFWYSDEGILLESFGIEGDTYEMKDSHPVYTDKILNNPEGLSISEAMQMNFRGSGSAIGVVQQEDYLKQYYPYEEQKKAIELWNSNNDKAKKAFLPPLTVSPEESDAAATMATELTTYVQETMIKLIQGSQSFDTYDEFQEKLKKLNVDKYIEIYQKAYDEYQNR